MRTKNPNQPHWLIITVNLIATRATQTNMQLDTFLNNSLNFELLKISFTNSTMLITIPTNIWRT